MFHEEKEPLASFSRDSTECQTICGYCGYFSGEGDDKSSGCKVP